MTQPTQAQIEAARKLLYEKHGILITKTELADAFAAAAQVGEQDQYTKQLLKQIEGLQDKCDKYCEALVNEEAGTIERCAQVADKRAKAFGGDGQREIEAIAHAIRKLKDER